MRVPLAMDATLLSDLIAYRKDRDRGVVAASRALLQLYRQRMPELLHKKERAAAPTSPRSPRRTAPRASRKGCRGGAARVVREKRARGEERDEAAEWEVGDGSGSDDGASDLGDLDGEGEGEGEERERR